MENNKIIHHYTDRYYFGEIFKTEFSDLDNIAKMLPKSVEEVTELESDEFHLALHGWYTSRFSFDVLGPNSKTEQITINKKGIIYYRYDVFFIAQKSKHSGIWYYCASVPFVRLGKILFEEIESNISRLGIRYARVNLTSLVSQLNSSNSLSSSVSANEDEPEPVLILKKYDCNYIKSTTLRKVSFLGDDLLAYTKFDSFIDPDYQPTLCGFSYSRGTRASIINVLTDRKGNYRFWLGKIWNRLYSLFDIIGEFEKREILLPTQDRPSAKTVEISNQEND